MFLTLPGLWLLSISTLIANLTGSWLGLWPGDDPLVSWWAFGVILGCTLTSDVVDWTAGILGAKRMGGTRGAMIAAFVGGIIGVIAGTMVLPLVGTLVGGAIGAGLAATLVHRTKPDETWKQSARVGAGASAGWFVAVLVKFVLCTCSAIVLLIAAWTEW